MEGKMVDEPGAVVVGYGRIGEFARKELADAARDSRIDRPTGSPIPDFNDAIAEIGRARRAAILALHRAAQTEVPSEGTLDERQALWEQSELARAESEGDFAWLNSATLWGLHSSLDALVEQNSPAVANLVSRIQAQDLVNQAAAKQPELAAQLPEGALDQIAQAAAAVMTKDFKVIKPRGNGAIRWEGPLGTVGLDAPEGRPIPPAMDQALDELCILRDVLSHRGGRVDQRAADDWPCGTLEVGSFVRVSQNQVRRYSAAVGAFGAEISRRLLARFYIPVDIELGNWEQHGFLI
jgi:hypothetical protein